MRILKERKNRILLTQAINTMLKSQGKSNFASWHYWDFESMNQKCSL